MKCKSRTPDIKIRLLNASAFSKSRSRCLVKLIFLLALGLRLLSIMHHKLAFPLLIFLPFHGNFLLHSKFLLMSRTRKKHFFPSD